jgi:hypothetical protein
MSFVKINDSRSKNNNFMLKSMLLNNPLLKPVGSSNYSSSNHSSINHENKTHDVSTGKKLTYDLLYDFIQKNINVFRNGFSNMEIKEEDISDSESDEEQELHKLEIGNTKNIKFSSGNLNTVFSKFYKELVRFGVLQSIIREKKEFNCSFLTSILSCLKNNFMVKTKQEQTSYILGLVKKMVLFYKNADFEKNICKKYKLSRSTILNDLETLNYSNKLIFKLIADFFHINIFIVDENNDNILVCGGDVFIPYKKNIVLFLINNKLFEPVLYQERKYLSYDTLLIKHLLNYYEFVEFVHFDSKTKKEFKIGEEDLKQYISAKEVKLDYKNKMLEKRMTRKEIPDENKLESKLEDKKETKIEIKEVKSDSSDNSKKMSINQETNQDSDEDDSDTKSKIDYTTEDNNITEASDEDNEHDIGVTDIELSVAPKNILNEKKENKIVKEPKYTKEKLSQMKVDELTNIAKSNKIDLTYKDNGKSKKKTKAILIEDILKL